MVIQRWQSVLLLLAVIAMAVFCLTPFAYYGPTDEGITAMIMAKDAPVLLTVSVLIAVLLLLTIFMYKNLRRQMTMTVLSMVLIAAAIVTGIFIVYNVYPDASFVIFGGIMLLVVTLVLALGAYRLMKSDWRKLRSYDRLR
ncbi:MAG: DUF4293 family protein [Muribaculaceae bacterium]|nr:DUF4293 family protein [Muribaculaceae bacterium]